jgi:hypothetical protein
MWTRTSLTTVVRPVARGGAGGARSRRAHRPLGRQKPGASGGGARTRCYSPPAPTPTARIDRHRSSLICFKCFRRFRGMLQLFHMDIAKVDRVCCICCKCFRDVLQEFVQNVPSVASVLIYMLHMFYIYVATVCYKYFICSSVPLQQVFSCCICFHTYVAMYVPCVSFVSDVCCIQVFQIFQRYVAVVSYGYCKSRSRILHMLQVFQKHIARVCSKCFICSKCGL